jgi:Type II CAAX prenyl endopeptidase Rce1-like
MASMAYTSASAGYWYAARAPRYSLSFAFPLLIAYELLAALLSPSALEGVRNGADVLLKSLFVSFGGRDGLLVFGALLVGTGAVLVWRDLRRGGRLQVRVFLLMAVESVAIGLLFGLVTGTLTGWFLGGIVDPAIPALTLQDSERMGLATQLMVSLGAGIYEELLFRVILVGAIAGAGRRLLGWSPTASGLLATLLGALIFSIFHYVGPYGDPWTLGSFTFRTIAGVLFSGLYLLRGFGITAWGHALYDVFLTVLRV